MIAQVYASSFGSPLPFSAPQSCGVPSTVAADGTPQDCGAEKGSGDPKLDAYTCAIILKRAKFQPARWVDGSPVYAVLRVPVTWAIGAEPSKTEDEKAYPADMEVSVSRLPEGAGERTSLSLMI